MDFEIIQTGNPSSAGLYMYLMAVPYQVDGRNILEDALSLFHRRHSALALTLSLIVSYQENQTKYSRI